MTPLLAAVVSALAQAAVLLLGLVTLAAVAFVVYRDGSDES